jgi:hypothetical protein
MWNTAYLMDSMAENVLSGLECGERRATYSSCIRLLCLIDFQKVELL